MQCIYEVEKAKPELSDHEFVNYIDQKIRKCIDEFHLLKDSKKILVAVSGGKDSTLVLHVLNKLGYKADAFTVDVAIGCYSKENVNNLKKFCEQNQIKLHERSFKEEFGKNLCYIQMVLKERGHKFNSCTVCGVLRRGIMNKAVREIGADVIVTGHNMDDECQAGMMNMFRNTLELLARIGPSNGIVKDPRFVPRVKPLYFVSDSEAARYSLIENFPVQLCECPCSSDSFRRSIKLFLNELESRHPGTKERMLKFFLNSKEQLRDHYKTEEQPNECRDCKEPSTYELCKSCQMMEMIS